MLRERIGINADAPVVLAVAASWASPRKGLEDLLALATRLPHPMILAIVGSTPSQLTKLPPNVVCIERTDSTQELAAAYTMASVLVNPTLEDNFPTVALEALACGTPIVTYATGGCGEQVTTETGFAVPRGDVSALLAATTEVVLKGKAAYMDACLKSSRHFSLDRMGQAYISLYRRVARVPHPHP
jgi:glycosyltransferase involved in cell wall biosynthesis